MAKVESIAIDALKPNTRNARTHSKLLPPGEAFSLPDQSVRRKFPSHRAGSFLVCIRESFSSNRVGSEAVNGRHRRWFTPKRITGKLEATLATRGGDALAVVTPSGLQAMPAGGGA
jgi:hypothetical protein